MNDQEKQILELQAQNAKLQMAIAESESNKYEERLEFANKFNQRLSVAVRKLQAQLREAKSRLQDADTSKKRLKTIIVRLKKTIEAKSLCATRASAAIMEWR